MHPDHDYIYSVCDKCDDMKNKYKLIQLFVFINYIIIRTVKDTYHNIHFQQKQELQG